LNWPNWMKDKVWRWLIGIIIAIIGIIVSIVLVFWTDIKEVPPYHEKEKLLDKENNENVFPALRVKFADNLEAFVTLTYQTQADINNIPKAISLFGSYEKAIESLHSSVRGAIYSTFETKTLDYVRKNREEMANIIIYNTKETQDRCGYVIVYLAILGIDEI
jgi:hypothetical protein